MQRRHLVAFQFHHFYFPFANTTKACRYGNTEETSVPFSIFLILQTGKGTLHGYRTVFTLFLRFDSAHCQFHEHNHGHKYPSEDWLVTMLGMRVCRVYVQWDTSACMLRRFSDVSSEDGNRQRQAYAHNNVAIKGSCQVGGVIERCTASLNPIRLCVWTTYRNARNVHKPFVPLTRRNP